MLHSDSSDLPQTGDLAMPGDVQIGSNTPGSHPSSKTRPVHHDEWSAPSATGYRVSDHLVNEPVPGKPFKVIIMGAGAAGIDFLHHAPTALADLDVEIVCYDKNTDIGGTVSCNAFSVLPVLPILCL